MHYSIYTVKLVQNFQYSNALNTLGSVRVFYWVVDLSFLLLILRYTLRDILLTMTNLSKEMNEVEHSLQ